MITLRVEYDLTLSESVELGRYDYVDPYVTQANFPSQERGNREVRVALASLDAIMSTGEALAHHQVIGLRPATIRELLALGASFPDMQRAFPIVAFGSACLDSPEGPVSVPVLRGLGHGSRDLYLDWAGYRWSHACRILGIPT